MSATMQEFDALIEVTDRLFAPGGCSWDREQTMETMRSSLIEEACELLEAIDLNNKESIREELGDFLFTGIYFCKLAEKEQNITLEQVLATIREKMVRRHPRVFGENNAMSSGEVLEQWDEIKKKEKGNAHRKSALDGVPKGLPALAKALEILKKMAKAKYLHLPQNEQNQLFDSEDECGKALMDLVCKARASGIDPEHALRKNLSLLERDFRQWESKDKAQ